MTTTLTVAAWLLAAVAGAVFSVAYTVTRRLQYSLAVGLDFLLAAGLLRLASVETWTAIASAAATVAVRKLVMLGLSASSEGAS